MRTIETLILQLYNFCLAIINFNSLSETYFNGIDMGFVYADVIVHGIKGSKILKMLIDTGSTYVVLDPETISELGLIETPYKVKITLADRRVSEVKLYIGEVEVKERRGPVFIAELNTPVPLLGVHALETLGFKINPKTGELEEISPEGGYILYNI